jgi:ankyrin repeat protein
MNISEYWKKKNLFIEYLKKNDLENIKNIFPHFINNNIEINNFLLLAAQNNCKLYIFTFLLENGASPNYNDVNRNTVLHYMRNITIAELELFISHGLDIHQRFENGKSILHIINNVDTFQYLISNYTDFNTLDDFNNTPLHSCCQTRTIYTPNPLRLFGGFKFITEVNIELFDYLLKIYDVNLINNCYHTVLHNIIMNKCLTPEIFNKLIAKNIDLSLDSDASPILLSLCIYMPDIYWIKQIIQHSPPETIRDIDYNGLFITLSYSLMYKLKLNELLDIYKLLLSYNIEIDNTTLEHIYSFNTKDNVIIFEFLLNHINTKYINMILEFINKDTLQNNEYKSIYIHLSNNQKLKNFKFIFYALKFKNKFRKILWENIREPKIKLKYSPKNLSLILQHCIKYNYDIDTKIESW